MRGRAATDTTIDRLGLKVHAPHAGGGGGEGEPLLFVQGAQGLAGRDPIAILANAFCLREKPLTGAEKHEGVSPPWMHRGDRVDAGCQTNVPDQGAKPGGSDTPAAARQAEDSAWRTRSGVSGARRMRTPVASNTALTTAAATGRIDGSPAPVIGSPG